MEMVRQTLMRAVRMHQLQLVIIQLRVVVGAVVVGVAASVNYVVRLKNANVIFLLGLGVAVVVNQCAIKRIASAVVILVLVLVLVESNNKAVAALVADSQTLLILLEVQILE